MSLSCTIFEIQLISQISNDHVTGQRPSGVGYHPKTPNFIRPTRLQNLKNLNYRQTDRQTTQCTKRSTDSTVGQK